MNDLIPLTHEYSTADSAHKVLEQIVEIQCTLAKSTDYGLPMIDKSLLRVANTPYTHFLLQAELNAIKQGLQYEEKEYPNGGRYKGYYNKDGQLEGVGISIFTYGEKYTGEYHLDKLHGCAKLQYPDPNSYWGEYKDHNKEGYGTEERASGDRYIGQYL